MPKEPRKPSPALTPARSVAPRSWAAATAAALGLAVPLAPAVMIAPMAIASESGEEGEAAAAHQDGTPGYLTELGLFEAAQRIVGALYNRGDYALALEHFQASHHAQYETLEHEMEEYNAPGFSQANDDFVSAITTEQSTEIAAARLAHVLAAISTAGDAAAPTAQQRVLSMKSLLDVAANDYAAGVEGGTVVLPQEYRDAWGFVETVRARAQELAGDADVTTAAAGNEILAQLAPLAPLFPDLTATETAGDPSLIGVSAAWIEIIALRLP